MSKLLTNILKFLLILLLAGLCFLVGYLLIVYYNWSYLMLGLSVLAVFVLIALVYLIKRLYFKHKEEKFIRNIVEKDNPQLNSALQQEHISALYEHWKRGIALLRSSQLSKKGNPLYHLPWFMIFGESGSGKSTAISHARLSHIATDAGPLIHIPNTRNCDWWFFEEAVVLDTAGRYAIPLHNEEDTREWQEFLNLLASYRKKEPLNGLVLTLSAEKLLTNDLNALTNYGKALRQKINTLTKALDAEFPLYILVTKMDKVLGMTELADLLTAKEREQSLGQLNKNNDMPFAFTEATLNHVSSRLKDLGLILTTRRLSQNMSQQASECNFLSSATLFSKEFESLHEGIKAFVQGVFTPTSYYAHLPLRGLFFSSGKQEGKEHSQLMKEFETFKETEWRGSTAENSLFLHDFFAVILPKERPLSHFIENTLSRFSFKRHLNFIVWLGILLTCVSYFSLGFISTRSIMFDAQEILSSLSLKSENFESKVIDLNTFINEINELETKSKRNWWLYPSYEKQQNTINEMKKLFLARMRENFFTSERGYTAEILTQISAEHRRLVLAMLTEYTSWTVQILLNAQSGTIPEQPIITVPRGNSDLIRLVTVLNDSFMKNIFITYARWEQPEIITVLIDEQKDIIQSYLDILGHDLQWATEWLNSRSISSTYSINEYFPGTNIRMTIPSAYTQENFQRLTTMLNSIADATTNKEAFLQRAEIYKNQYANEFRNAWWDMAQVIRLQPFNASSLDNPLLHSPQWRTITQSMGIARNPYFIFIYDMARNFHVIESLGNPLSADFLPQQFIQLLYLAATKNEDRKTLEQFTDKTFFETNPRKTPSLFSDEEKGKAQKKETSAIQILELYVKHLQTLASATHTDTDSLALTFALYAEESTPTTEAVLETISLFSEMENLLDTSPKQNRHFWYLVQAPFYYQIEQAIWRSTYILNKEWERKVLYSMKYVQPNELYKTLFTEGSPFVNFLDDTLYPLLKMNQGTYLPDSWQGITYPFNEEFLKFINEEEDVYSTAEEKYTVSLTAQPVNVNPEAELPYLVSLILACDDKDQVLDNYNYPISKDFIWQPETCSTVTLDIHFDKGSLTKSWENPYAFQTFLKALNNSTLTLTAKDFPPSDKNFMESIGLTELNLIYLVKGKLPVLAIKNYPKEKLPLILVNN